MEKPEFIWIFDINHRRYRYDENGRSYGGPIMRDHWVKCKVVGETSRSWIIDRWNQKIPKKGFNPKTVAFDEEQIDQQAFVQENAHLISEAIRRLDYEKLKAVADLIDYKPVSGK